MIASLLRKRRPRKRRLPPKPRLRPKRLPRLRWQKPRLMLKLKPKPRNWPPLPSRKRLKSSSHWIRKT